MMHFIIHKLRQALLAFIAVAFPVLLTGCAILGETSGTKFNIEFGADQKSLLKAESRSETKQEEINFEIQNQNDSSKAEGTTQVQQDGVKGVKEVQYTVMLIDGREVKRLVAAEKVITSPVPQIVLVGTATYEDLHPAPAGPAARPPPQVVTVQVAPGYCSRTGGYSYEC